MGNKIPFASKAEIERISASVPTPFYVYDEVGIRKTARLLKQAFSWNKGFKEYFAVKATPNPVILKILREEGCGVDCSSLTELLLSKAVGFAGHEIMFSSNETPIDEFKQAFQQGAIINLDDISLINDAIEACQNRLPEMVCCRYNPGGEFIIDNHIMDHPKDAKYGMTKEQLIEAVSILSAAGVKKFGIHSFLASNTQTNDYYPALAKMLFSLAVELHSTLGIDISFINLSGGIGIDYKPSDVSCDIIKIGERVRQEYNHVLMSSGLNEVAIFTELGRFMLAPHGALITRAIHEKHIYKDYIGVDACACNLMRPAMYGAYHHITVLGKENLPEDHVYDIVGGLCENNDKFAIDRCLPHIETGDFLFIHDAGAHGHSMGYNYNGKLRSAEVLLKSDSSFSLIRRAETPKDYFSTLDFLGLHIV